MRRTFTRVRRFKVGRLSRKDRMFPFSIHGDTIAGNVGVLNMPMNSSKCRCRNCLQSRTSRHRFFWELLASIAFLRREHVPCGSSQHQAHQLVVSSRRLLYLLSWHAIHHQTRQQKEGNRFDYGLPELLKRMG